VLSRSVFSARRLRWRISFGRPIELDDLHGRAPDDAAREATRRLCEAVTTLEATLVP
jgi:hypothetical protein